MKPAASGYDGFRTYRMLYSGNIVQYMRRTKDAE